VVSGAWLRAKEREISAAQAREGLYPYFTFNHHRKMAELPLNGGGLISANSLPGSHEERATARQGAH